MNKKKILSLGIMLILIIIVIVFAVFLLKRRTIVNIKMEDNGGQNSLYELKIKKNGNYKLITKKYLIEGSDEITSVEYKDKLTDKELGKIETIMNYVKNKSDISESKAFKYNYEKDNDYSEEIKGILENMIIAIENISMNEIKIGEISRRDYGNTMLNNIITTQLN